MSAQVKVWFWNAEDIVFVGLVTGHREMLFHDYQVESMEEDAVCVAG